MFDSQKESRQDIILFNVGKRIYGLRIDHVIEIIRPIDVKKLPLTPPSVKGLVRVRDDIYSVLSLEKLFNLDEVEATPDDERYILVKCVGTSIAIYTRSVETLSSYDPSEITKDGEETPYIEGTLHLSEDKDAYLLSLSPIVNQLKEEAKRIASS